MSHLLDVNFLLACGWASHARHSDVCAWLLQQNEFSTTSLSELGFIRISMSPAYRASFADAQVALAGITSRPQARTVPADVAVAKLPILTSYADVTDAYLVELARAHGLKLATLDDVLCQKPWAATIAENPI